MSFKIFLNFANLLFTKIIHKRNLASRSSEICKILPLYFGYVGSIILYTSDIWPCVPIKNSECSRNAYILACTLCLLHGLFILMHNSYPLPGYMSWASFGKERWCTHRHTHPESIQLWKIETLIEGDTRYKKHCTQDNDALVPFKVGTLGPQTVLPIALSYPVICSWISSVVWNLFPFKGDFSFGKSQKLQNNKSGL